MSEKYIRVEDAIHMLESTETLCGFGKYLLENPPSYCPTYSTADILAGQWVPVTERLPENKDGDWILGIATADSGNIHLEQAITLVGYDRNEGWYLHENPGVDAVVTHWMPLPQPPKEANHA